MRRSYFILFTGVQIMEQNNAKSSKCVINIPGDFKRTFFKTTFFWSLYVSFL